jgi:ubiquinone/menaquinone biosynthesis C-methylase UbiE
MTIRSNQEIWRLSREYDQWHQHIFNSGESPDQGSPWYRLVLQHLEPLQGKKILEIACGRGGFAATLRSRGATVFGADFSATALRIAQQKARNTGSQGSRITLLQADAQTLPFGDCTFDVVISCETIEHLTNPSPAVREMARVCRQGGTLYLTTPNYLNFMGLYLVYDAILRKDRQSSSAQPVDHHWLFLKVRRIITRAGWKIVKSDGTVHQVPIPGADPVRLDCLERNPQFRRLLSPVALHYFVLATKRGA